MRLPLSSSLPALVCAAAVLALPAETRAQGKKVYISVDMEGISGVNGDDQTGPGGAEYGRAAKALGFKQVASGPFVRSSYHAREMAEMF